MWSGDNLFDENYKEIQLAPKMIITFATFLSVSVDRARPGGFSFDASASNQWASIRILASFDALDAAKTL